MAIKKVESHVALSAASTFVCLGCILIATSLAVDTFQMREKRAGNKRTIIWRGIMKDCHKKYSHVRFYSSKCYDWSTEIATEEFLMIHRDLMLVFIGISIFGALLSILVSILATATTSRIHVYIGLISEGLSGTLGLVAAITYAAKFIYPPWRPSVSLFLLAIGSLLICGAFLLHYCTGDVKFCGRMCCQPQSEYEKKKYDDVMKL